MDKQGPSEVLASSFLSDSPQWWIVIWKWKANEAIAPEVALGQTASSQHQRSKPEHPGKMAAVAEVLKHQNCKTREDDS